MRRFFALLAVAAALVSGCSGPSASPATTSAKGPGPAVAAGAANPCAIFPLDLANKLLTGKGDGTLVAHGGASRSGNLWYESQCAYSGASSSGELRIDAVTYLDAAGNPGWQEIRSRVQSVYGSSVKIDDVSGLGDQAYTLSFGGGVTGICARKGRLIVYIGQTLMSGRPNMLSKQELVQLADAMLHNYQ